MIEVTGPINEHADITDDMVSLLSVEECDPLLVGRSGAGRDSGVKVRDGGFAISEVPGLSRRLLDRTADSFLRGCLCACEFETEIRMVVQSVRGKQPVFSSCDTTKAVRTSGTSHTDPVTLFMVLNPYLARDEFTLIGATDHEVCMIIQGKISTPAGHFATIDVSVVSSERTENTLLDEKDELEHRYAVAIGEASFCAIADVAERFYGYRAFPE